MNTRLTKEEVIERIKNNFEQDVILIGEYVNKRTKIRLHCNDCGHEWEALPTSTIYKDHLHKCPNCGIKTGKTVKCAYCGKEIYRTLSQLQANKSGYFYCSVKCGNTHKNYIRLENGEWENSKTCYRARALMHYPHKCMVCGWDEDDRILEIHHLDSNRDNNTIENLSVLCPTCHRKITLKYYELTEDFKLIKK